MPDQNPTASSTSVKVPISIAYTHIHTHIATHTQTSELGTPDASSRLVVVVPLLSTFVTACNYYVASYI